MRLLKSTLIAATIATMGTQSFAGGFAAEVVEPPVVVTPAPAPRSSWGMILPIALLVGLIALAVSSNDDDEEDTAN